MDAAPYYGTGDNLGQAYVSGWEQARTHALSTGATVRGTRVLVEILLGNIASGMSVDEVAEEYEITRDDVLASVRYAAATIAGEELREVGN